MSRRHASIGLRPPDSSGCGFQPQFAISSVWKHTPSPESDWSLAALWRHLLLCGICSVTALFAGCGKPASTTSAAVTPPSILRLSQRNEPADLDPALAALPDEFFIIRALSEGLVSPAPTGQLGGIVPAAAQSWDVSTDGLTYTFHLRPGLVWSNGEPLTAGDFLGSYRRVLAPATAAPKASLFYAVKNARAFVTGALADFSAVGFAAPDPLTLVVTLERPTPQFLVYAASGPWIPVNPRVVAHFGRTWTRPEHYVGNGPFTLAAWQSHQRIVVQKNPRFRDPASVRLDEIDFVAFDSGDTEDRAYRAGQIDLTMSVPFGKLETYAHERPQELHQMPLAETRYLAFNCTRPPLNDPRVRRALSLTIDRETIVARILHGGEQSASRVVPPSLGSAATGPLFDPALARQLLAEAGYPGGKGFPRLELSTWIASSPVLEAIQSMWRTELGLDIALATREAKVHVAALREGRYDIGFITAIPDVSDALDVLHRFTTGAPDNYAHWSDPTFDALYATAATASDNAHQTGALRRAEDRLLAEAPVAPLYFNAKHWLMSPRVHDWHEDALWTRHYLGTFLDAP